ncbi:TPA: hypothetical protein PI887_002679 [Staphylococcus aureus]|nr:hypothetical protein [Staphylococcus aureus]
MNKDEILEILEKHDVDNENLASALAEIFQHLPHSSDFKDEMTNNVLDKTALDSMF